MKDGLQTPDYWVEDLTFTSVSGTGMDVVSGTVADLSSTAAAITTANITNGNVSEDVAFTAGSPYSHGITFNKWAAEAIISGGMWVIGSKGVLKGANVQAPLGIAMATTASGATCEVLVFGPAYAVADANIAAGEGAGIGAGAALNTVAPAGAGSSHVGTCITGASSGGKCLIWVGK